MVEENIEELGHARASQLDKILDSAIGGSFITPRIPTIRIINLTLDEAKYLNGALHRNFKEDFEGEITEVIDSDNLNYGNRVYDLTVWRKD